MEPSTAAAVSESGAAGQAVGFDDLYRALWPRLVRLGHLLTGSEVSGQEVAQEAFVGLLRRADRVEQPASYLRRAVVNLAINVQRRTARERAYLAGLREPVQHPPEVDETWAVIATLPRRQRAVLVLRYYEDLPEADIAAVLGCRPGTVKSLASRALTRLRQELS
jgi:RNA polymerase sigma-70 factor (sigma-E family)